MDIDLYAYVYVTALYIIKKVEITQIPTMDKWINKMWHIHTMEYYSTF